MAYNPIVLGPQTQAASQAVTLATDTNGPVFINDPTTTTNKANILAPGGASVASGNALLIGGTTYELSFTYNTAGAQTAYNVSNYAYVSVSVNGFYTPTTGTAGVTFQCSNDNSTWYNVSMTSSTSANTSNSSTTVTGMFSAPLMAPYFRLNTTGTYSSGNTTGTMAFSTLGRNNGTVTVGGGWTGYLINSLGNTLTLIQSTAAAAKIGGYNLLNTASAPVYLQIYDVTTTGSVTIGTTVPNYVFSIPANGVAANGVTANVEFTAGLPINNGIVIYASTALKTSGAPSSNLNGMLFYRNL